MFSIRNLEESDYQGVRPLLNAWADGVNLLPLFPRHVFIHFRETQFLAFEGTTPCGIISGFLSQSHDKEAYVRVIALAEHARGKGLGRQLYERFIATARQHERNLIRAITSPGNRGSIAFHESLGFEIEPGDHVVDGVAVHRDYASHGEHRVLMVKRIDG